LAKTALLPITHSLTVNSERARGAIKLKRLSGDSFHTYQTIRFESVVRWD